ncbi:MAG: universal stress protein [Desulfobacterales bacterium]|nr:MAG: universal stress protein [Desulfobacterales bacterium]
MEKKILLVVDGSIHSTHAVDYAVRISSVVDSLTYTLFHVQPTISQYLLDEAETDLKAKADLKKLLRKNDQAARGILETHKARMVRMGISEKRIQTVTRQKVLGICKDILDSAQQGLYDAILIGRRGLSRLERTFMGSTTASLVEHSSVIPVWVVDGDVTSMKVMLAVDGSEPSLRAVDHLGFMVGKNDKIKVTLFHVTPTLRDYCVIDFNAGESDAGQAVARGAKRCIDHFYAHAQHKFTEGGLQENQIELKVVKRTMDVGKAIVNEARKGEYGTVVVGRRGINGAFFMGSISRYVIDKISGRAVWVVC